MKKEINNKKEVDFSDFEQYEINKIIAIDNIEKLQKQINIANSQFRKVKKLMDKLSNIDEWIF